MSRLAPLLALALSLLLVRAAPAAGKRITSGGDTTQPAASPTPAQQEAPAAIEPEPAFETAPAARPPAPVYQPPSDAGLARALSDFNRILPPAFSQARISATQRLILIPAESFLADDASRQKASLSDACAAWMRSLRFNGMDEESTFLTVLWPWGGQLWRCRESEVAAVEAWSDDRLAVSGTGRRGGLFGFLGGQMVVNGPVDSNGVNARLGTTLFHDRYDLAFSYAHSTVQTDPAYSLDNFGVVSRALFPLTERMGWNVGFQFTRTLSEKGGVRTSADSLGGVAGLNFYVPNGSFDVTFNVTNGDSYALLLGYTIYFPK